MYSDPRTHIAAYPSTRLSFSSMLGYDNSANAHDNSTPPRIHKRSALLVPPTPPCSVQDNAAASAGGELTSREVMSHAMMTNHAHSMMAVTTPFQPILSSPRRQLSSEMRAGGAQLCFVCAETLVTTRVPTVITCLIKNDDVYII